ncbi:ABC transporter permease subunit [Microbacterium paludicola]|uniref:ABC transporter permease subunit n=1 Tax=Microbacterium paludicola TaxID=300019 RepID=UPI0031DE5DEB
MTDVIDGAGSGSPARAGDPKLLRALTAAQLYYLQDLTMDAIARELRTSRSSVSRLISHARETGLVDIRIHSPVEKGAALERQIRDRFGIIPAAATPTGVFLLRQYMLSIPDELIEAARVDGAGEFRIFARIVLPLCTPALAVVAIFSVMWRWSDFLWPLVVAQSEEVYTLPVALARFNAELTVPFNLILAMGVVSTVPVVIIFVLFQRQIATGIAGTGIK